jgi:hypothetical protein
VNRRRAKKRGVEREVEGVAWASSQVLEALARTRVPGQLSSYMYRNWKAGTPVPLPRGQIYLDWFAEKAATAIPDQLVALAERENFETDNPAQGAVDHLFLGDPCSRTLEVAVDRLCASLHALADDTADDRILVHAREVRAAHTALTRACIDSDSAQMVARTLQQEFEASSAVPVLGRFTSQQAAAQRIVLLNAATGMVETVADAYYAVGRLQHGSAWRGIVEAAADELVGEWLRRERTLNNGQDVAVDAVRPAWESTFITTWPAAPTWLGPREP